MLLAGFGVDFRDYFAQLEHDTYVVGQGPWPFTELQYFDSAWHAARRLVQLRIAAEET